MTDGILWAVLHDSTPLIQRVGILYPNPYAHHVTLIYGTQRALWASWLGQSLTAMATHHCWNDEVQAVRLRLPDNIPCHQDNPHITISTAAGIPPARSERMLQASHQWQLLWLPVLLTIEFHAWERPNVMTPAPIPAP